MKMKSCLNKRLVFPVLSQIHSEGAVITRVAGLLLEEECDYLLKKTGKWHPSKTEGAEKEVRTSNTAYLPERDPVIKCVKERLATISGFPVKNLEPLQVTKYTVGQMYKAHLDGHERNMRVKTVFIYLQDKELAEGKCGGATTFYRLKNKDGRSLRVYPRKGDALIWDSSNDLTLHAGEAVTCPGATKIGLNAWFGKHTDEDPPRRRPPRPKKEAAPRRKSAERPSQKKIKSKRSH